MKTTIKFLFVLVLLVVAFGALYIFKYQKLVNEEYALNDERCLKINPLIADRKTTSSKYISLVMASASAEAVSKADQAYLDAAKKYLVEENTWLSKDRQYLDGWDFKILNSPYPEIKILMEMQNQINQLEYAGTKAMVDMYKLPSGDFNTSKNEYLKIVDIAKKQDDLKLELAKLWNNGNTHSNEPRFLFRSWFIKFPPSKCPINTPNSPEEPIFPKPNTG